MDRQHDGPPTDPRSLISRQLRLCIKFFLQQHMCFERIIILEGRTGKVIFFLGVRDSRI